MKTTITTKIVFEEVINGNIFRAEGHITTEVAEDRVYLTKYFKDGQEYEIQSVDENLAKSFDEFIQNIITSCEAEELTLWSY